MTINPRGLLTVLLLSGAALAAPAAAKDDKAAAAAAAAQPAPPKLSKPVQLQLIAAQKALTANDAPGALAAVKLAEAVPNPTADDVYMTNAIKINVGIVSKDNALIEEGIQKALATGKVPADKQASFIKNAGSLALNRKDYATATRYYEQLAVIAPNDSENVAALAELYQAQKQSAKAVDTLTKAITASRAAGQTPPETWYRRQLAIAYDGKLPQTQSTAMQLVQAYPNAVNWRDVLVITRESLAKADDQTNLDFMRLQSAAGALNGERDYAEYAGTALDKGLPGEAKTAVEAGIAKGMLATSKPYVAEIVRSANAKVAADKAALPSLEKESRTNAKTALGTADAYYGYANYAKAADLYKLAAAGTTVDADTANLRLGAALARAGDKAGAAAAFKLVKGGARATLAQYWLIWIGQAA